MTPRHQALLTLIAAQLEDARAEKALKECGCAPATVHSVLQGQNFRISTLLKIADALNCEVKIEILKRSA